MPETTSHTLARQLSMVPWLLTRPGIPLAEAAAHFGRTPSQMTRDIMCIAEVGDARPGECVEFDWDLWEEERRIDIRRSFGLDLPPRLTDEEATALIVGLSAIVPGLTDEERERIPHVALLIRSLTAGADTDTEQPLLISDSAEPRPLMSVIRAALENNAALEFDYRNAEGRLSHRVVDPVNVRLGSGGWQLYAYCRTAQAVRRFRLDRMEALTQAGISQRKDDQPALEIPAHVVRIRVDHSVRWLADSSEATLVEADDHSCLVDVPVWNDDWFISLLIECGEHLLECPEVWRQKVCTRATRILHTWKILSDGELYL